MVACLQEKKETASVEVDLLRELIEHGDMIYVTGIAVQELLSGVRDTAQFEKLLDMMTAFTVLEPSIDTRIAAARLANLCRAKGVAATTIDLLIASICLEHGLYLLTSDTDFKHIQKVCALKLAA